MFAVCFQVLLAESVTVIEVEVVFATRARSKLLDSLFVRYVAAMLETLGLLLSVLARWINAIFPTGFETATDDWNERAYGALFVLVADMVNEYETVSVPYGTELALIL